MPPSAPSPAAARPDPGPNPAPPGHPGAIPGGGSEAIQLTATDGVGLAADLHLPAGAPLGAVLLAPAMAVPRRFYAPFARALADGGLAVLALDYRGIGGSAPRGRAALRRLPARIADWADHDLPAATAYLRRRFPGLPLTFVGHSIGGQLLGLLAEAPFAGALLVGAQTLALGNWDAPARAAMAAFFHGVLPAMVGIFGYLPMKALGQGHDLPPGVARDWAWLARTGDGLSRLAAERGGGGFARLAVPLRAYAVSDDRYAPPRGVRALAGLFAAARVEVRDVAPRDVDRKGIGHFGFFRPSVADTLWAEARTWLLRQISR